MKTPLYQIAAVLSEKTLQPSFQQRTFARSVAAYLLDTGRTGALNSLARDIIQDRAAQGIVEVTAVSAHRLSERAEKDIRAQVRKLFPAVKHIIINERLEPALIGGVRLEFPDAQLDLSIRNTLNRFKALTTTERMTA